MRLLFQQEINTLIKNGFFSEAQKRQFVNWLLNAESARKSGSLNPKMNQYDKAEKLLTWYTFAPLFKMNNIQKRTTINELLEPILGPNAISSKITIELEKALPPSKHYLDSISTDHPVQYIRKEMERHKQIGSPLEGNTFIDVFVESEEYLIPIEAKFTSDIEIQTTYSVVRNQIARTIDVTLEEVKKRKNATKIIFLLCVPKLLHNHGRYFFYKMNEYKDIDNIKHDIPHQSTSIETFFEKAQVVYWKDVATTILKNAIKWDTVSIEEVNLLKVFFEERLIQLSL